jgi:acetoin:2,6-dichlorophenolindophenol oxidoreductase subunit alpha
MLSTEPAPSTTTYHATPHTESLTVVDQVELYRLMVLCRVLEQTCCELNPRWFPAEGEEAAIVGSFYGLRADDFIAPHYRGPFIAYYLRGAKLDRLIGQVLAKANGYARGRALGFTGPIEQRALPWVAGDLGTSLGVATGTAVGHQYDGSDRVTVCTFGDGTTNRGDFHEALNLAAVWKLPIVYVCQHNQFSISLHSSQVLACSSIASRAAGYGMPGISIDGNDVLTVHTAVKEAVSRARAGQGPTLIEACTYRVGGHWASDPATYRPEADVAIWRTRDPVARLEATLRDTTALDADAISRIWEEVRSQVTLAVQQAQSAPSAEVAGLGLEDTFAPTSS